MAARGRSGRARRRHVFISVGMLFKRNNATCLSVTDRRSAWAHDMFTRSGARRVQILNENLHHARVTEHELPDAMECRGMRLYLEIMAPLETGSDKS